MGSKSALYETQLLFTGSPPNNSVTAFSPPPTPHPPTNTHRLHLLPGQLLRPHQLARPHP
jgi:hypothetical protein